MKHLEEQTLYLMVRVAVKSTHKNISDTVNEIENLSRLSLSDTDRVSVLETEILLTRVRNFKNINYGTSY